VSKAANRHYLFAALLLLGAAGVICLAVLRYVDFGQERKLLSFHALASSLEGASLAASAEGGSTAESAAQEWLEESIRNGNAVGGYFVKKGSKVAGFDISRPAALVVDLGRDAGDAEKLTTLTASLDKHFSEGGRVEDLDLRQLTWVRAGSVAVGASPVSAGTGQAHAAGTGEVAVGASPVFGRDGEFLGVAAVVVPAPATSAVPALLAGLALLAGSLVLFGLLLAAWKRPVAAYAVVAAVGLLASTALAVVHNKSEVSKFVGKRQAVTGEFVNATGFSSPGAPAELDRIWERVFKMRADVLRVAAAPNAAFGVEESRESISKLLWNRTFPIAAVLLVCLMVGLLALRPLSGVIWGVSTMPGAYAYVAPAMLGLVVLVVVPFIMGVGLGFFNADFEFVGLTNFYDILVPSGKSDTNFYYTLGFTVLWTASNVVAHVGIGLALAMILVSRKVRFKGVFRVLLIVPWAVPNYITALIWKWMFTAELGAVNLTLSALGVDNPPVWFGPNFWTNYFAALMTNIWLGFPFMMVVSMGALQSIPADLYEAADIDGASRWQKFVNITAPLLKPALFPAIILGCIWTFNMFNVIFLVTRGNPDHKTNILITEAYRFFCELNQYGVAAAYCVLIFVILLLYTLITNRITKATQGAFE